MVQIIQKNRELIVHCEINICSRMESEQLERIADQTENIWGRERVERISEVHMILATGRKIVQGSIVMAALCTLEVLVNVNWGMTVYGVTCMHRHNSYIYYYARGSSGKCHVARCVPSQNLVRISGRRRLLRRLYKCMYNIMP